MMLRNTVVCSSWWSQTCGLMFSRRKVLVFVLPSPRRVSLHMWFVFFPIDVVFLDERKRVVEIKTDFRPFSFFTSQQMAKFVVELPCSDSSLPRVGERVCW